MGIPKFGWWLVSNAKQAFIKKIDRTISSLSIDGNGMIHKAYSIALKYDEPNDVNFNLYLSSLDDEGVYALIYEEVGKLIVNSLQAFDPKDALIFAVDGVAPGAKIQQQRSRREKSALREKTALRDNTALRSDNTVNEITNLNVFDRNAVTPGTDFMIGLDNYLQNFFRSNLPLMPTHVYYSSHLTIGEGEHKIMDYYRKGTLQNLKHGKNGAHILYGLDGDLVLLAGESGMNHIYLCRENEDEIVDIDMLKGLLLKRGVSFLTFIIIMMFVGNDFLPQSPSCNEMNYVINTCIKIVRDNNLKLYNESRSINWSEMKVLVLNLAYNEETVLKNISVKLKNKRELNSNKFLKSAVNSEIAGNGFYKGYRDAWYVNELAPKDYNDELSYAINVMTKSFIKFTSTDIVSGINKMCESYMNMMEWVVLYYTQGTMAINHDLSYQFYHTPLLQDLYLYLNNNNVPNWNYKYRNDMFVFNSLQQLVSVIPMNSIKVVPKELQVLYSLDSPIRDMFPTNFVLEMDGKAKEHEGIAIIPFADRGRVVAAVSTVRFDMSVTKWLPREHDFYYRK